MHHYGFEKMSRFHLLHLLLHQLLEEKVKEKRLKEICWEKKELVRVWEKHRESVGVEGEKREGDRQQRSL